MFDPSIWAVLRCECSRERKSYDLLFRREGGKFFLKGAEVAIKRIATATVGEIEAAELDWARFEGPQCGITRPRSEGRESALPWPTPIISCHTEHLFCTRVGLVQREDGWWWLCPRQRDNRLVSTSGAEKFVGEVVKATLAAAG